MIEQTIDHIKFVYIIYSQVSTIRVIIPIGNSHSSVQYCHLRFIETRDHVKLLQTNSCNIIPLNKLLFLSTCIFNPFQGPRLCNSQEWLNINYLYGEVKVSRCFYIHRLFYPINSTRSKIYCTSLTYFYTHQILIYAFALFL